MIQVQLLPLAHRSPPLVQAIQALIALAHAQEARLLHNSAGTEPATTVEDVAGNGDIFLGAMRDDELVGVLRIAPDDEARQLCIATLAVHPAWQRQGIGRLLVQAALDRGPGMAFAVSTTAANGPALALYRALGFVPYRRGVIGVHAQPLIKLRRAAC